MFERLGQFVSGRPWTILAAWLALAVTLRAFAPDWQTQAQDDDVRFLPAESPVLRGLTLLEESFPSEAYSSRAVLVFSREDGTLTNRDYDAIDAVDRAIGRLKSDAPDLPIGAIHSPRSSVIGDRLKSAEGRCALIQVGFSTPYLAAQTRAGVDRVEATARAALPSESTMRLDLTGPAGFGRDLVTASAKSLEQTTWATVALVVVVLMCVYRSPLLALIPLITIGTAAFVAIQVLALATLIPGVRIVNIAQVFAVVILFGAGTDYCLFLVSRYREQLENGAEPQPGTASAVRAVGGALAGSAATVVCGLGMMGFAEFGKIRCAGPVIAAGLAIGLVAVLTITPALLAIFGRAPFWPGQVRLRVGRPRQGIWDRIALVVEKRPGRILAAGLIVLVPLAYVGLGVEPVFNPTGDLSPTSPGVRGMNELQKHFTPGETGPITILLESESAWSSPEGRALIESASHGLARLDDVAEVRSLTQPLGEQSLAPALGVPLSRFARESLAGLAASRLYLSEKIERRSVTRIDVVLKDDPFSPESLEALGVVESYVQNVLPVQAREFGLVRSEFYGVTVHSRDMAAIIRSDRLRVNSLVTLGIFVILFAVVRSWWVAVFLLGTVILGYLATLGLTAAFAHYTTSRPFGVIEWRVPFFLFTILIAVGEDYNILLVSRVLQEKRGRGWIAGTRRGLAATGGTISACGLIMAGTFGTLMLTDLSTMRQIGFALAVGVLLDTFFIRPLIVPSFLTLVGGVINAEAVETGPRSAGAFERWMAAPVEVEETREKMRRSA